MPQFKKRAVDASIYTDIDRNSPIINKGLDYYFNTCEANGIYRHDWKGEPEEAEFARKYVNPLKDEDMQRMCNAIRYAHQEGMRSVPQYDLNFVQDVEDNITYGMYITTISKSIKQKHKWRLFMILIECVEAC